MHAMSEIVPGGPEPRPINSNMSDTVWSLVHELPRDARTAAPNGPLERFANDQGYATVFAEAVAACDERPQGLRGPRLALVDAPGFIPSTLPEMPGDITVVTSRHPRLTDWMQYLIETVSEQKTPGACMDKLLERDNSGAIRAGLEMEQQILGDLHFTSSTTRFAACQRAIRNKPTILHTMDIGAPYNALSFAHACDFIGATLVFANVSDRGDESAMHIHNLLGRLSGGATAMIVRSSIAGKSSRKGFMPETLAAPRASLCRGAADYGSKATADSFSIYS